MTKYDKSTKDVDMTRDDKLTKDVDMTKDGKTMKEVDMIKGCKLITIIKMTKEVILLRSQQSDKSTRRVDMLSSYVCYVWCNKELCLIMFDATKCYVWFL